MIARFDFRRMRIGFWRRNNSLLKILGHGTFGFINPRFFIALHDIKTKQKVKKREKEFP